MQSILLQFKKQFSVKNENSSESSEEPDEETLPKDTPPIFHDAFKLPITYLDKSKVHSLQSSVCSDLELVVSQSDSPPMYDILFKPTHSFAKELIPYWSRQYTSDPMFLEDTKQVIETIPAYVAQWNDESGKPAENKMSSENADKIVEIWKSLKEDEEFMDRYSYIDWDMLRYLNNSSSFLQIFNIALLCSPVFSLLLPFLFFLIPFFILQIKGVDINFSSYLGMLMQITKGHFIGNILQQLSQPLSFQKLIYLSFFGAFYGFQIYQNIQSCLRFHLSITRINDHLYELKKHVEISLKKMETFSQLHGRRVSYSAFCRKTQENCIVLRELKKELHAIEPFSYSYDKVMSIGYMMKCYYRLHNVETYENAVKYSLGFEAYVDNLMGVWENLENKHLAYANYYDKTKTKKHFTKFEDQYYPAHLRLCPIANDCALNKNMVISGPNAAGKTTLLKTTAINILFSQQVGCGFYSKGSLVPYTHIHSYLNIPDTSGRDSLFQAESRRCKEIITMISSPENKDSRHFAILDELYSGTNPTEAGKSAYAFLKYLSKYENIDFMLTTHYMYVCKKFKKSNKIQNYKMGVELIDASGGYRFTYKLEKGISKIQGAMKILKEMDYPQEMLDNIQACR